MKYFAAPWPHLSLISVIDILLVAVIIYELLALIKGTRAAYMLVGVAGLALAFIGWAMKSRKEEAFMTAQFGAVYSNYQGEVKALIPFVL